MASKRKSPKPKTTQARETRLSPFLKPTILLLGIIAISVVLALFLFSRNKENIVLKPESNSRVAGLSHPLSSWGHVADSDSVTGYRGMFEATGSLHFTPQDNEANFMYKITSVANKVDVLQQSEDMKSFEPIRTIEISNTEQLIEIEFAARAVDLYMGTIDSAEVRVNAQQFAVVYDPEAITIKTQSIIVGQGVSETTSSSSPHLVFMTQNGESIFNLSGVRFPTRETSFEIEGVSNLKVFTETVSLGSSPGRIKVVLRTDNQLPGGFEVLFVQGTFGYARLSIDDKFLFSFSTVMPYVYLSPPTGTLVFGNLPRFTLLPEQNVVELHATYDEPFSFNLTGEPPQRIQPMIAGKTDFVLLNETSQIAPSKWDTLGDEIRATLIGALLAALGFVAVEYYKGARSR